MSSPLVICNFVYNHDDDEAFGVWPAYWIKWRICWRDGSEMEITLRLRIQYGHDILSALTIGLFIKFPITLKHSTPKIGSLIWTESNKIHSQLCLYNIDLNSCKSFSPVKCNKSIFKRNVTSLSQQLSNWNLGNSNDPSGGSWLHHNLLHSYLQHWQLSFRMFHLFISHFT